MDEYGNRYYIGVFAHNTTDKFLYQEKLYNFRYLQLLMLLDYHKFIYIQQFEEICGYKSAKQRLHTLRHRGLVKSQQASYTVIYTLTTEGEMMVDRYKKALDEAIGKQLIKIDEKTRNIESNRRADKIFGVS